MNDLLEGLRILDLGHYTAGPYCAKLFADAGADVIHVERPGAGDPARALPPLLDDGAGGTISAVYAFLNAGKRSVTLDFATPAGAEWLRELVRWADIVVENFAPGTLERHGFGMDELLGVNPSLVRVSITNFGLDGPSRDLRGTSLTLQAAAALMDGNGDEDREPLRYPRHISEYWAGSNAAYAALIARRHARLSGEGQHVDVSIQESLVASYFMHFADYQYQGALQARGWLDTKPASDGPIIVNWHTAVPWDVFAIALEAEELILDPELQPPLSMTANAGRVADVLSRSMRNRTRGEWFARAKEHRIPAGMVQTLDEVADCEHLEARAHFDQLRLPGGSEARIPGPPYALSEGARERTRVAPRLGEHNAAVFGELLGHPDGELRAAAAAGVI